LTPTPLGPPPDVEITSPAEGAVITDSTDVIGTVTSQALDYWTLEYGICAWHDHRH
jgi:hypothetical protein